MVRFRGLGCKAAQKSGLFQKDKSLVFDGL